MIDNDTTITAPQLHKFLTFNMADENYGIEVTNVREIIGLMRITRVPGMPDFMRGVINLRGRIIPVIDLRMRFKTGATLDTERTCIIIVQIHRGGNPIDVGLIVEEVADVIDLSSDSVDAVPEFGLSTDAAFLRGMGKHNDTIVILLDIDALLTSDELTAIQNVT